MFKIAIVSTIAASVANASDAMGGPPRRGLYAPQRGHVSSNAGLQGIGSRGIALPSNRRVYGGAPYGVRSAPRDLGRMRGSRYGAQGGKFGPRGGSAPLNRREPLRNSRARGGFGGFGQFKDGHVRLGKVSGAPAGGLGAYRGGYNGKLRAPSGRYGGRRPGLNAPLGRIGGPSYGAPARRGGYGGPRGGYGAPSRRGYGSPSRGGYGGSRGGYGGPRRGGYGASRTPYGAPHGLGYAGPGRGSKGPLPFGSPDLAKLNKKAEAPADKKVKLAPLPKPAKKAPLPAYGQRLPYGRPGPAYGRPGPAKAPRLAYGRPGPAKAPRLAYGGPGPAYGRAGPGPAYGRAGPGPAYGRAGPGPAYGRAGPSKALRAPYGGPAPRPYGGPGPVKSAPRPYGGPGPAKSAPRPYGGPGPAYGGPGPAYGRPGPAYGRPGPYGPYGKGVEAKKAPAPAPAPKPEPKPQDEAQKKAAMEAVDKLQKELEQTYANFNFGPQNVGYGGFYGQGAAPAAKPAPAPKPVTVVEHKPAPAPVAKPEPAPAAMPAYQGPANAGLASLQKDVFSNPHGLEKPAEKPEAKPVKAEDTNAYKGENLQKVAAIFDANSFGYNHKPQGDGLFKKEMDFDYLDTEFDSTGFDDGLDGVSKGNGGYDFNSAFNVQGMGFFAGKGDQEEAPAKKADDGLFGGNGKIDFGF